MFSHIAAVTTASSDPNARPRPARTVRAATAGTSRAPASRRAAPIDTRDPPRSTSRRQVHESSYSRPSVATASGWVSAYAANTTHDTASASTRTRRTSAVGHGSHAVRTSVVTGARASASAAPRPRERHRRTRPPPPARCGRSAGPSTPIAPTSTARHPSRLDRRVAPTPPLAYGAQRDSRSGSTTNRASAVDATGRAASAVGPRLAGGADETERARMCSRER